MQKRNASAIHYCYLQGGGERLVGRSPEEEPTRRTMGSKDGSPLCFHPDGQFWEVGNQGLLPCLRLQVTDHGERTRG
ncbi:hypothetical protein [Ktedonobacter racemifer]|nr:hypothetical protein [Ktedonobacter racemifer]